MALLSDHVIVEALSFLILCSSALGDSTNVTSTSRHSFTLCYTFLITTVSAATINEVQPVCAIDCAEKYEILADLLLPYSQEVDDIIANGIIVDGQKFDIEFFLGGDHKVSRWFCSVLLKLTSLQWLLLALGLKSDASSYPCVYCVTVKNKLFTSRDSPRTIEGICRDAELDVHGAKGKPIFNIPIDHVVIDSLHIVLVS